MLAAERVYGARYRIIGPLERAAESLWLADDLEQSRRCIVQLVMSWGGSSVRPESWRRLSAPERVDAQERLGAAVRHEVDRRAFRHPAVLQPMQVIPDMFTPDEPEHSGVPVGENVL